VTLEGFDAAFRAGLFVASGEVLADGLGAVTFLGAVVGAADSLVSGDGFASALLVNGLLASGEAFASEVGAAGFSVSLLGSFVGNCSSGASVVVALPVVGSAATARPGIIIERQTAKDAKIAKNGFEILLNKVFGRREDTEVPRPECLDISPP